MTQESETDTTKVADSVSKSELSDLLDALKPFAIAAEGISWESTSDNMGFWPINSLQPNSRPLFAGDMRKAMEIYKKYTKAI